MTTKVKLTKAILTPKKDTLPSKDERKKMKAEQEALRLEQEELKVIAENIFNDIILESNLSTGVLLDLPELLKQLMQIYLGAAKANADIRELNKKLYETNIADLDVAL